MNILDNLENFEAILGLKLQTSAANNSIIFEAIYNCDSVPLIADHKVYHVIVVPGSFHIARVLTAIARIFNRSNCFLTEISFKNAIIFHNDNESRTVQLCLHTNREYDSFELVSVIGTDKVVNGIGKIHLPSTNTIKQINLKNLQAICNQEIPILEYQQDLVKDRYQYGPGYIWVEKVWRNGNQALSKMRAPTAKELKQELALQPGLIDCSFQAISACFTNTQNSLSGIEVAYIPIGIESFNLYSIPTGELWCHVTVDPNINTSSKLLRADIELIAANGDIVVEMLGFTALQAPSTALFKSIKN